MRLVKPMSIGFPNGSIFEFHSGVSLDRMLYTEVNVMQRPVSPNCLAYEFYSSFSVVD